MRIVKERTGGIHPAYEETFQRFRDAVSEMSEGYPPAGLQAAVEKTAARMSNRDVTYSELQDRYGVGTSAIHNWLTRLQEEGGYEIEFTGYPDRIVEAAVDEARQLIVEEEIGKGEAARRVAPIHGLQPSALKKRIPGEGRSKYDRDGTTERLHDAVETRPRTTGELVEEFDMGSPPGNYLRRRDDALMLDYVFPPPENERVVVWYTPGSEESARKLLAYRRACHGEDIEENLPSFLSRVREESEIAGIDIPEEWEWEILWAEAALREWCREKPQSLGPLFETLPDVTDYLLDFDDFPEIGRKTFFDAYDVTEYLEGYGEEDASFVAKTLTYLEEQGNVLESFGGRPTKFDSREIDEPGILVLNTIVDSYSSEN